MSSRAPRTIIIALALWMLTAALYWPARTFEFVNLDDARNVSDNPVVLEGLTIDGLWSAFRTTEPDYWRPLTWVSLMIDTEIHGVEPGGYHLTNVLLHALGAALLFAALQSLTGATLRSAMVAVIFAVHPLRVESVAWITERKDVLSGVFAFGSLWAYSAFARHPGAGRMALTAALLAMGLMCKSILVTWPCVFLLMDLWPLRRIDSSGGWMAIIRGVTPRIREKTPLFILAAISCAITMRTGGKSIAHLPLDVRLANVIVSFARYLGKIIWPSNLAVYYPYPGIGGAEPWPMWIVIASAAVLLALGIGAWFLLRRAPYMAVGWLWFIGMLVPVIGLVQVGDQGLADRFTYLPGIGVSIMLVWLAGDALGHARWGRAILTFAAAGAIATLCVINRGYLAVWKNTDMLYQHALAVTDNNRSVRGFYGDYLFFEKKPEQAIAQFEEAARFTPDDPLPHYKLGCIYGELERYYDAQREFGLAIERDPTDPDAHFNLAVTLWHRNQPEAAREHLEKAIELNPAAARRYNDELRPSLERGAPGSPRSPALPR